MIFWICFALLFPIITILWPTSVVNRKNLPPTKKQNVIIACNHMSNIDLPLVAIKFRRKFTYIGKAELFKNKFLGWLLRKFDVIPVDRTKADLGAIKKVLNAINRKRHVCICPQGTRSKPGETAENAEMLEIIKGAVLFDAGRIFGTQIDCFSAFRQAASGNPDWVSYFRGKKEVWTGRINEINQKLG